MFFRICLSPSLLRLPARDQHSARLSVCARYTVNKANFHLVIFSSQSLYRAETLSAKRSLNHAGVNFVFKEPEAMANPQIMR